MVGGTTSDIDQSVVEVGEYEKKEKLQEILTSAGEISGSLGGGDDYRRGETEWGEKGRREREGRRGWGKREKGEERCMPDLPPLIPSPPLSSLFFPLPPPHRCRQNTSVCGDETEC